MNIQDRIQQVKVRSVQLYNYRQSLQLQLQETQTNIMKTERELLLLDGDLRTLEAIVEEEKGKENAK